MSEIKLTPGISRKEEKPVKVEKVIEPCSKNHEDYVLDDIYSHVMENLGKTEVKVPMRFTYDSVQKFFVLLSWLNNNMNYEKTCKELKIGRATVYRKIEDMKMTRRKGANLIAVAKERK